MVDVYNNFIKEEAETNKYSRQEVQFAIDYLNNFLKKLNSLTIYEDGNYRKLNELEKVICIYDFVTKRKYNNMPQYSQDIIGAINHDCFVCASFSKMIQILCDACNIYSFIKYGITSNNFPHANNEVLVPDKKGNFHLLHLDATIDCLNYEDIWRQEKMGNNIIPRINTLLLVEEDINKYRNTLQYRENTNSIYANLVAGVPSERLFQFTESDKIYLDFYDYIHEEILWYKIEDFHKILLQFSNKLTIEYSGIIDDRFLKKSVDNIHKGYESLLSIYEELSSPIDFEELLKAILNVQIALITYQDSNREDYLKVAQELVLKQLQLSLDFQLRNFHNYDGKSFMFTLTNYAFHNHF